MIVGIAPGVAAKAIRLTLLSPKMIHEIVIGASNLTAAQLRQSIPPLWVDQDNKLTNFSISAPDKEIRRKIANLCINVRHIFR